MAGTWVKECRYALYDVVTSFHARTAVTDASSSFADSTDHFLLVAVNGDDPTVNKATTLEDATATAHRVFLDHGLAFEHIVFASRAIDNVLTPKLVMLGLDGIYCVVLFIACAVEAHGSDAFQPKSWRGSSAWFTYQVLYFRVINSSSVSALLIGALLRLSLVPVRRGLDKMMVIAPLVILLPVLATHCLAGFAVFLPLMGPVVVLMVLIERFARRHNSLLVRAASRVLLNVVADYVLSASFNLAALYLYRNGTGGTSSFSYLEAIVTEFEGRSMVCTIDTYAQSFANMLQVIGSVATPF